MKARPHAEIAGAGFAGLATATALCQRGWSARVHEVGPELRAFGAGIFIWENGLRVLKALGAYEDVIHGSHQAPGYEGRNDRNERISYEVFGPQRGTRMVTMTRQHLYSAMLSAANRAGVEFVTSSEVVAARAEGELTTADGRVWRADLVVGADGVRSNVRRSLGIKIDRVKYDYGVIRLLMPRGSNDTPGTNPDNVLISYSPEHRVLYVPCNASELYLALAARDIDKVSTAIPVRKDVWIRAFPFLQSLLERIGNEGRYDTYETNRLETWSVGAAALVGDSAHSMPPTLGQGAGCAIMNGLALGVCLGEGQNIIAGLRAWEQRERPLTDHTQNISSRYAETRAGDDGESKWNAAAMRAAHHIPTGAEQVAALKAAIAHIGGVETRYFYEGTSGPPVLLIHGVGMSGAGWLRNIDALAKDFQVCAPDLLGNGLTHWGDYPEGPPHPHVLKHLADFVDHLGWRRFSVVGSSFGALIAALLYLRMPERVEKLVGISSASFIATDEELAVALRESYANGSSAVFSPTLETCQRRMERICFDPAAVPPELVFMQLTEYAVPWAKKSYEQRMQGMMNVSACRPYRVQHRLEELRLPALLLWGLNDPRAHYPRAQEAVTRMADARLIAFDRCKHFPHLEHSSKFNGLVRAFLLDEGQLPSGVI